LIGCSYCNLILLKYDFEKLYISDELFGLHFGLLVIQ